MGTMKTHSPLYQRIMTMQIRWLSQVIRRHGQNTMQPCCFFQIRINYKSICMTIYGLKTTTHRYMQKVSMNTLTDIQLESKSHSTMIYLMKHLMDLGLFSQSTATNSLMMERINMASTETRSMLHLCKDGMALQYTGQMKQQQIRSLITHWKIFI